jgi:ribosomal subunit interface protein
MNLTISGHHLEVTPALRGYVTSKLDRITRHFDQVVDVKVLLTIDNMCASRAATCLPRVPTLICMPQSMN